MNYSESMDMLTSEEVHKNQENFYTLTYSDLARYHTFVL